MLKDTDLHALGFTRVLLLNEGAAFRADYEGYQVVGWPTPRHWQRDCPDIIADVIAPRRMAFEGGNGSRAWPDVEPHITGNTNTGTLVYVRLLDFPILDRTKLGTTVNPATGENTYERSDAETMAASAIPVLTSSTSLPVPAAPQVKVGDRVLTVIGEYADQTYRRSEATVKRISPSGRHVWFVEFDDPYDIAAIVEVLP